MNGQPVPTVTSLAESMLPNRLTYPQRHEVYDLILEAHHQIASELGSEKALARLTREYERLKAARIEPASKVEDAGARAVLLRATFSVFIMLLTQDFAQTIAYDPAIRLAVHDAVEYLGYEPDVILTTARQVKENGP